MQKGRAVKATTEANTAGDTTQVPGATTVGETATLQRIATNLGAQLNASAAIRRATWQRTAQKETARPRWSAVGATKKVILQKSAEVEFG